MQEMIDKETEFASFQVKRPDIIGTNLIKADCPIHGKDVYFERVEPGSDIFQCANRDHKIRSRGPIDQIPGLTNHLQGT